MFITSRNFSQLRELISLADAERNNPEVILIGCRKHPEMIRRQSTCHCTTCGKRGGYDWTKRYPWNAESALKNSIKQFVIDGEAVVLGVDGVSDFNALHSGRHSEEVQLCAFDVMAMDGDDLRRLPLSIRKANLAQLLRARPKGMFINPFEQGEIGPDLFRKACEFGLEGLVSKHRDRPYQFGRSKHWVKVKNRKHHTFDRVQEAHQTRHASQKRGVYGY